jgi:opacity protein-like surface antigen
MNKRLFTATCAIAFGLFATAADARSSKNGYRNSGGASTSRTCLRSSARALLNRIESLFGRVHIISTCRPGARIAGTGRRSKHATGEAIDFNAPSGKKAAIVRWLIANHKSGGTMTYRGMSHIHVDVGYHFVSLGSGGRGGYRSSSRRRHAASAKRHYASVERADHSEESPSSLGMGSRRASAQRRAPTRLSAAMKESP